MYEPLHHRCNHRWLGEDYDPSGLGSICTAVWRDNWGRVADLVAEIQAEMNIVPIKKIASDLPGILREMADQAEAGELTDLVAAYHLNEDRAFIYSASLNNCLVLSALLQQNCIDRQRK